MNTIPIGNSSSIEFCVSRGYVLKRDRQLQAILTFVAEIYELYTHMDTKQDTFFALVDGNQLFYSYTEYDRNVPTFIFLNGLSQSTLAWSAVAPALNKHANLLLIDLVFQGKSSAEGAFRTYDQHAHDVAALVREMKIERPVLCGLSYGSAVAQHALVLYPDLFKGAVLMSTFAHNTAVFNAIGESWIAALHSGGYPLMLEVMLPVVLGASYFERPLIPISAMKEMRVTANPPVENLLKLMEATNRRGDYRNKLVAIKVPVVVVHGAEDLLIPVTVAEEVSNAIPQGRTVVLERAGHTLNLEAIPQVIGILKDFVEELK